MSIDEFREVGAFFDDDEEDKDETKTEQAFDLRDDAKPAAVRRKAAHPKKPRYFLGLSPAQRFILATMLFSMICLLGFFALIAAGKIVPPGL